MGMTVFEPNTKWFAFHVKLSNQTRERLSVLVTINIPTYIYPDTRYISSLLAGLFLTEKKVLQPRDNNRKCSSQKRPKNSIESCIMFFMQL